jgi:CHAT domain-containing protein
MNPKVPSNPDDYLKFLQLILKTVQQSDLNTQIVYSLLQANLDKLDNTLIKILRDWAITTWSGVQPIEALIYAEAIVNFSNLIRSFPHGNIATNLEIAIAGCEVVAPILNWEAFPEFWATTQNMLGAVYRIRLAGNCAQNIEQAIVCYQNALQVRTQKNFPEQWAETQNNLGNAYNDRILGERAKNVEAAITCFQAALKVRSRTAFPVEWATTQNNLGIGYYNRLNGDRAQNLEQAIICYQNALQIRTQKDFPEKWAETQNNLANAYGERIKGDRAENIEAAITAFQAAVQIYTRSSFPQDWAMIQNNLGEAYRERINGISTENLLKAISAYEAALQVYTRQEFPEKWAIVQNNLGIAYYSLQQDNRAENLERAIFCYHKALQVRTQTDFPEQWADTQNNLGNTYSDRIYGSREENLDLASRAYQLVFQVYNREDFSAKWAKTHNNLVLVYRDLGQSFEAIRCFQSALEVYTPTTFPVECLVSGRNLGNTAYTIKDWDKAIAGYSDAIDAVEQSRSWANTDKRRQEILSAAIDVYAKMVQVCINTDRSDRALEYVERSKARNLVELLAARDIYPKGNVPQTVIEELDRLRREIVTEQRRIEMRSGVGEIANLETLPSLAAFQESRTYLNQLQQELDELIRRDIQPYDPTFRLTQRVEPITFEQMRNLLPNSQTALIEWYIAEEVFLAFIVAPHSQTPFVWQSSTQDYQALMAWISTYLTTYYDNKQHWQSTLDEELQQLAIILHLDYLLSVIPSDCSQLILIPHRFLHLFPLHSLPVAEGRSRLPSGTQLSDTLYLLDKFPSGVRYVPSCQLLQLTQSWNRTNFSHLFGVQNPTLDLAYSDIEMAIVRQAFHPHAEILVKAEARKEEIGNQRLQAAHCVHFACHGIFDLESPLRSALVLAGVDLKALELESCLTLGEIFGLNLSQCRLVVLSACETGLTDPTSLSDEYVGLPSGFLYAGSPSVVSSLWTISDISTTFLVAKFCQNLQQGSSVAVALNQAQRWLRDATCDELQQWMEEQQLPLAPTLKISLARRFRQNRQPFQSPFYWAAFCAVGK